MTSPGSVVIMLRVPALRRVAVHHEIEELAKRIGSEREGAALMCRLAQLSAVELAGLEGLIPKEGGAGPRRLRCRIPQTVCPGREPG